MINSLIHNLPLIFFFYGLAFFYMGLAITLEVGRSKTENEFAWALVPLGWFGLVHGGHEWFEMCYLIQCMLYGSPSHIIFSVLRLILLAGSFFLLLYFSFRLIVGQDRSRLALSLLLIPAAIWLVGILLAQPFTAESLTAADVFTRYSLAIPGSILAAWGLVLQYRRFAQAGMSSFGRDVLLAALAFLIYGAVGQVFSNASRLFPSTFVNAALFETWFGFPIQLLRAGTACMATVFIVRSLRSFEVENILRMERLRAEMLHHTVQAQETERQRIARELHDQTGQTLTALGLGLRGLSDLLRSNPERAAQRAQRLELLSSSGLAELQRIMSGLRPPQLDDLGLFPALRWYVQDVSDRFGVQVQLQSTNHLPDLSPEIKITLYRIAQEAITNAIRHAQAQRISVTVFMENDILILTVEDDGIGFNAPQVTGSPKGRPCWGLMGMQERARLIGADYSLTSHPGLGTRVSIQVEIVSDSSAAEPTQIERIVGE